MEKIENPFIDFPNYNCFVCSPANKIGLKLDFYKDENCVYSFFTPKDCHSGLPEVMHGGLASVLLDELMFWAVFIFYEKISFTTSLSVNYKKYIPVNGKIKITGKVTENKKRFFKTSAVIKNNGNEVLCTSEGIYFCSDLKIMEKSFGVDNFPEKFKKYCR